MAVRIISGSLKGRKLNVSDALGLRPTPDRVRETAFNWLQAEIPGSRCLDLFAGSGGLGLESYSRGAAHVTSVEMNTKVFQVIRKTVDDWKLGPHFQLVRRDAFAWLAQWSGQPYHLIFLDPPFDMKCLDDLLEIIQAKQCLDSEGLLYIERPPDQELPSCLEPIKERKAGMVLFGLYKFM